MDEEEPGAASLASPLIREPNRGWCKRYEVVPEVKKQLWLAGPLVTVSLLWYSLQLISLMFVGHLGELSLSGASMATSFGSVTGFSLLMGLACALDTFCGQSFGAQQYHMLGVHMQRAMFILLLVSIPLAVIWANTRQILVAVGQNESIAEAAGTYARYMIPSLFAYGILQCLMKFLQTQTIVFPMMISAAITTLALYVKFSPACTKTWTGFSKEAFHDVLKFLKLAIPSAVMVCLEMWSFELMVLLSGLLPDPELETSVLSISLNTAATVWMIPFGLSCAISTRVSNELGAGNPEAARLAVYVVLGMTVLVGATVGTVLVSIRNVWGYAYSDNIQVVRYVAVMLPIVAASNFLDGLQCVLSGNARGCGWQKIGAFVNLGSYYLIGIPCGVLLAFVLHVGGKGLWLGIICALVVQVVCLLLITLRTDWDQEANKASNRVHDSTVPAEMVS
ncbi:hypothetical protein MLD38_026230 [Melastoma candidum]|uniref:Uncharacterized protein n=1 Tax=Melastoma candidum TaxID=119954 RepID=A0ACB9NZR6_9MYRT|nr:hypothetical protein MLD38_026230 [Melastoma candidum]